MKCVQYEMVEAAESTVMLFSIYMGGNNGSSLNSAVKLWILPILWISKYDSNGKVSNRKMILDQMYHLMRTP